VGAEKKAAGSQGSGICTRPNDKDPSRTDARACCNEKGTWGCAAWDKTASTWK
jgi:hypothetical protein